MSKIHEIAVRIVKPGRNDVFVRRRSAFIAKLKSQKGVLADREFESFFALPTPDEQPVFIGMTTYARSPTTESSCVVNSSTGSTPLQSFPRSTKATVPTSAAMICCTAKPLQSSTN